MNVFITGATSGLGLALAQKFIQDGHNVGTCSPENYEQIKDRLPIELDFYHADVSNIESLEKAFNQFIEKNKTIDLMVANAGINHPKDEIVDFNLGRKVLNVNCTGVVNTFDVAIKAMKPARKGQIVAMSSLSSLNGLPRMSIYGASKAFVRSFCESMEFDLKPYNIKVTCIAPGYIKTNLTKNNKHAMPFALEEDNATQKIYNIITNQKSGLYPFPLIPSLFMGTLSICPRSIYKSIIANFKFF